MFCNGSSLRKKNISQRIPRCKCGSRCRCDTHAVARGGHIAYACTRFPKLDIGWINAKLFPAISCLVDCYFAGFVCPASIQRSWIVGECATIMIKEQLFLPENYGVLYIGVNSCTLSWSRRSYWYQWTFPQWSVRFMSSSRHAVECFSRTPWPWRPDDFILTEVHVASRIEILCIEKSAIRDVEDVEALQSKDDSRMHQNFH